MKPTFWFSLLALILVIAAFAVQQASKVSFIAISIASNSVDAKVGLASLQAAGAAHGQSLGFGGGLDGLPVLTQSDAGFRGLSVLVTDSVRAHAPQGMPMDTITRFINACAAVPDKRGLANVVVVEWAHGQHTDTSYEEISELISKDFDRSIWPWQFGLFMAGIFVTIGTIWFTHFHKQNPQVVDTQPKGNDDSATKAYDPDPTGDY